MAFEAKHWKVKYDDFEEALGLTFRDMQLKQCFNNDLSEATHTFELNTSDSQGVLANRIPAMLQEIGSKPFTFEIMDLNESEKITHKHFISDYRLDTVFAASNRSKLIIKSYEYPMLMDLARSDEVFRVDGVLEQAVQTIASRYGITMEIVETSAPIPEFVNITKANYTDYEFITRYVCRRIHNGSNGGYVFFTIDGLRGVFSTPGYNAKEAYLPPEQLLKTYEAALGYESASSNGLALAAEGLDPFTKTPMAAVASAFPTQLGNSEMWLAGLDQDIYPHHSRSAMSAHVNALYTPEELKKYAFTFDIHGSSMIDDKKLEAPLIINFSNTEMREPKEQRGILWELKHTIKRGNYLITATCLRHQITV